MLGAQPPRAPSRRRRVSLPVLVVALCAIASSGVEAKLRDELGRSESQIRSAPYRIVPGRTVWDYALDERLERLAYRRVHQRPTEPGQFFWGNERFWIYRRGHRFDGQEIEARLFMLPLRRADGLILDFDEAEAWLEPEILSETLEGRWAARVPVDFERLPKHVWQCVLAAEDARFFEHGGLDGRSLARALLANLKAGEIAQGGSTITQQLIKNRDLSPRRTLGRKASEALRALALEADYDKEEILEAYLDLVYLGHIDGVAIHGYGAAALLYFSKEASALDLAQSALLAAIIQGPNRLTPLRHPERAKERRNWVLDRLIELGWIEEGAARRAQRQGLGLEPSPVTPPRATYFLSAVAADAERFAKRRLRKGRGIVAETTLDPWLQELAESTVRSSLEALRRSHRRLRGVPLKASLVALDAHDGGIVAYVGGDPAVADDFDRARQARRQPGSTVKPLLLLEAFEDCGIRKPLTPATRIADAPLRLELDSGPWSPTNFDQRFRGVVDVRQALRESLNVPFVRIARWCGFRRTAIRLRKAGLDLPRTAPPSFSLGAVETTPLELAQAYSAFATNGLRLEPRTFWRLERPQGRLIQRLQPRRKRATSEESAYLVRDLLLDAATRGTARGVAIEGQAIAAKTGTTDDRRDAWLAGIGGSLVTVVWLGRDDGQPIALTGATAAGPLWRQFMERAILARPPWQVPRPEGIQAATVDPRTGLLVRRSRADAREELFREETLPPKRRIWRIDKPARVIE